MARNMIDYSTRLLKLISNGVAVPNIEKMRIFVDPINLDAEKETFKNLEILNFNYIVHDVKVVSFNANDKKYILLTNCKGHLERSMSIISDLSDRFIHEASLTTGMLMALVIDSGLKPNPLLSEDVVVENLLSQHDSDDYKGHELDDLLYGVESLSVFEIGKNSAFYDNSHLEIGYYIYSSFDWLIHLPLKELIERARGIFISTSKIPKDNLFLFLTSIHWKHAYLELYRCIEGLYSIPRAIALKEKLNLDIKASEIAMHCSKELGWRRKEEESLYQLFNLMSLDSIKGTGIDKVSFMRDLLSEAEKEHSHAKVCETLAKRIYKIRNQLVHQGVSDSINVLDEDWPILMTFLMNMMLVSFESYDLEID
ncbi:hypothetical protein PGT05_012345 [Yersinia enterocolitica]|uniref:hypothetical protein n=1 Tax=Yersinia enterocolitica TaxID=630 RepID=UPI003C7C952E|nr:hypothetical protein [Yersinia enterocolitica]